MLVEAEVLASIGDNLVDAFLLGQAGLVRLFLFALGEQNYDTTGTFTACAAHSLDETDGRLLRVVADDQVNLSNVQALFANACGHQRVVAAISELANYLCMMRNFSKRLELLFSKMWSKIERRNFC